MFFQPLDSSIVKVMARIFALLCLAYSLQSVLERGLEARIPQIDFSACFDWVIHQDSFQALLCGSWGFCAVCFGSVSLESVTVCRGGWLSEEAL